MGIPNFLPEITTTVGRAVDLREYKGRRIAIDINGWIQRECKGSGQLLANENHISNYGRALLAEQQQEENEEHKQEEVVQTFVWTIARSIVNNLVSIRDATESKILAVFDGATPPIKRETAKTRKRKREEELQERDRPVDVAGGSPATEARFKANRRAGAGNHFHRVVDTVIAALRQQSIPFLVSPYEADGQLAFLQKQGHVDLVVTDDSDLIAYGPPCPLIYKLGRNDKGEMTQGILVRQSDFGARHPGSKPTCLSLLDWSPSMLAVFFTAAGGDYCRKLHMIGVKTAASNVQQHFLPQRTNSDSENAEPPLRKVIHRVVASSPDGKLMSDDDKQKYEQNFMEAVFTYRHALVYDPMQAKCRYLTPLHQADEDLMAFESYRDLVMNTEMHKGIVGEALPPTIATYIAEGWICPQRMALRQENDAPEEVKRALEQFKSGRHNQVP